LEEASGDSVFDDSTTGGDFSRGVGTGATARGAGDRGLTICVFSLLAASFAISSADGAVLGACLALAAATVLFIFYIRPDVSDLAPRRSKLDQLLERRDTIYDNLRDLRFEFRSGKYSEGDYEAMKNSLEDEAAIVLAEIARVTESQFHRPPGRGATESKRGGK
jgi:hypothetical protein